MSLRPMLVLVMLVGTIACGDESSSTAALDAGVDAGVIPRGARPSPDGLGWCCPTSTPTCDCAAIGGFTPDPSECWRFNICDAHPDDWRMETDEHGCTYYRTFPPTVCCNCPDAGWDAGAEPDAGLLDAGAEPDAGLLDAGAEPDAGLLDAGADVTDARTED